MSLNPNYTAPPKTQRGSNASQYSTAAPQSRPLGSYDASMPRDIPRQGQYLPPEAQSQYYGITPPQQFGTSPQQYSVPQPPAPMYGTSPSQQPQFYGTTPPQQQYLAPSTSQPSYPPPPSSSYSTQQGAYSGPPTSSRRESSVASHHSHHSHRSHQSNHSKRSRYDEKDGRRKNSRVQSPRPTFGDSIMLVVNSLKGAFDSRK